MQSVVDCRTVSCPVCGDPHNTNLFAKDSRDYVRCDGCELVYSLPRPAEDSLAELYDDIGENYFTDPRMLDFYFGPHRFERELRMLGKYLKPGSSVFDVGCCVGAFVHAAQTEGYRASGMDISTTAVECGRARGLDLRAGDVLTAQFAAPFDAVCLWATLEHVNDPLAFLNRSFELLRPGGWLFASVPNFSSLSQKILGKKFNLVAVEHLNFFIPRVLREVVASAGFEVGSVWSFGFNPLNLVRDFLRGSKQLPLDEQIYRATLSQKVVSSPLRHAQRFTERVLDICGHAADCLVVAAQKPGTAGKLNP